MDVMLLVALFLLLTTHFPSTSSCSTSNCGDPTTPDIRFPFGISNPDQSKSCGYPGFHVSCDGNGTSSKQVPLINLPNSGNFIIKSIDYTAQEIWVNDPNHCLPKRLLTLNLSTSPFTGVYYQYFTFFNCSTMVKYQNDDVIGPISCLSGSSYFLYAMPTNGSHNNNTLTLLSSPTCSRKPVQVPVQWPVSLKNRTGSFTSALSELSDDVRLTWYLPECRACEVNGQMCGFKNNSNGSLEDIICTNILPNQGKPARLSSTTFIAVILVVCAPSLICLVGSLSIWIRSCYRNSPNPPLQSASVITPRPGHLVELGLEEAGIEFARRVVELGFEVEPSPDDLDQYKIDMSEIEDMGPTRESTCPICMAEYRRKDKVGIIPRCGHYFHADCINKWLLSRGIIDKTCPICRARVDPL